MKFQATQLGVYYSNGHKILNRGEEYFLDLTLDICSVFSLIQADSYNG